jgi:CheY-like chemotaxis protein
MTARFGEGAACLLPPGSFTYRTPKKGILIAVADHLCRSILEKWFGDHGFSVWAAADCQEAVVLQRAHPEDIGFALLDAHAADLDSLATLAALRQEAPSIACYFITTNLNCSQQARLLALGAAGVFARPLLLREATGVN